MADNPDQANANQGADPSDDIRKQNPGETTTANMIDGEDPHKVEKLAKAGEPAVDPNTENRHKGAEFIRPLSSLQPTSSA